METPMTEWNDDRLDELNERMKDGFAKADQDMKAGFAEVDKRFEKVDERFVRLEGEMKEGFAKVDERFAHMDKRFEGVASKEEMSEVRVELRSLNERFDRLLHAMAVSAVGFAGALLATLVGVAVL